MLAGIVPANTDMAPTMGVTPRGVDTLPEKIASTGVFLLFEEDGTFFASFYQNNAPGWGLRDLTCDGTCFCTGKFRHGDLPSHLERRQRFHRHKHGLVHGSHQRLRRCMG